ncbi:hypothetical protein [uncultured Clostridium sp.]|uniref:hypothetical protein n=1 Tax=uncultured Clostridium sp. TaxID=59620 RepID=UPI002638537E|nr:hypothetical protein [uncultured Clostridium sp.]
MRTDEPLTSVEIRENAIYFENLIEKVKKLFHLNNSNYKYLPAAVEIEHLKFVVENIMKKLSDNISKEDIAHIIAIKNKIIDKLQDENAFTGEIYDVDSTKKKAITPKEEFINNLEEVYDIDAFHEKNPDFNPKSDTLNNTEILKLKSELSEVLKKLENRLEKKLKK